MISAADSGGDLGDYIITELTTRCGLRFEDTGKVNRLPATWRSVGIGQGIWIHDQAAGIFSGLSQSLGGVYSLPLQARA